MCVWWVGVWRIGGCSAISSTTHSPCSLRANGPKRGGGFKRTGGFKCKSTYLLLQIFIKSILCKNTPDTKTLYHTWTLFVCMANFRQSDRAHSLNMVMERQHYNSLWLYSCCVDLNIWCVKFVGLDILVRSEPP